jgi:hypothetical protein
MSSTAGLLLQSSALIKPQQTIKHSNLCPPLQASYYSLQHSLSHNKLPYTPTYVLHCRPLITVFSTH